MTCWQKQQTFTSFLCGNFPERILRRQFSLGNFLGWNFSRVSFPGRKFPAPLWNYVGWECKTFKIYNISGNVICRFVLNWKPSSLFFLFSQVVTLKSLSSHFFVHRRKGFKDIHDELYNIIAITMEFPPRKKTSRS